MKRKWAARDRISLSLTRSEHQRFRALLSKTGLHPRVFFDRLLAMAEARASELVSIEPDSGVPAVG